MEVGWIKIADCDDDPKVVEIFGRYASAVIEYVFTFDYIQKPITIERLMLLLEYAKKLRKF